MISGMLRFYPGVLVDAIPYCKVLFRFCWRYVNHCNGDNNGDMRKNGELRWLKETLPMCHTVFDVGANVGDWTALALSINLSLEVHCFEPVPYSFGRLRSRQFAGRVHYNRLGLSDYSGKARIYVFGNGAGTNSLYKREGLNASQEQSVAIHLDTMDNWCERNDIYEIDLLKLDVEGHEFRVLKGGIRMLSQRRIRFIQFEYGGTYIDARILLKDMFDLLHGFQYRIYKVYPRELRHVKRYEQRLENFQYSNWVAAR